ncbi:hypothetical protein Acr_04g0006710 [Actinidia rufa]|uniref:Uncharacterized protein n=1 Tax=Actinidia rufa TaxID=165716 RepID=A0A7J0EHG8_9ERIC|nr:hypothetical protein Acr_04g0006710 [Actinidia rufa]
MSAAFELPCSSNTTRQFDSDTRLKPHLRSNYSLLQDMLHQHLIATHLSGLNGRPEHVWL